MLSLCKAARGGRRPQHRETQGSLNKCRAPQSLSLQADWVLSEFSLCAGRLSAESAGGQGGDPLPRRESGGWRADCQRTAQGFPPVQWRSLSSRAQWPWGRGGGEGWRDHPGSGSEGPGRGSAPFLPKGLWPQDGVAATLLFSLWVLTTPLFLGAVLGTVLSCESNSRRVSHQTPEGKKRKKENPQIPQNKNKNTSKTTNEDTVFFGLQHLIRCTWKSCLNPTVLFSAPVSFSRSSAWRLVVTSHSLHHPGDPSRKGGWAPPSGNPDPPLLSASPNTSVYVHTCTHRHTSIHMSSHSHTCTFTPPAQTHTHELTHMHTHSYA